ncbi:glycosyltransferase family 4 protein [Glycomyces arizonensis]|uniref:glycosyltransferase family 4 protein n=1 Tax=Glycomyces arizonensis TaxID=256035 RepID=UPI0009FDAD3D|nr:glycosyltransferase family 4 protein [Glycomyces arizonensis]
MRIAFLVRGVWGIGGTIRTTINTAEALAERGHEVTLVSCIRNKEHPDFPIDPRIAVRSLWDVREPAGGGEALSSLDRLRGRRPSYLDADHVNNMKESSALLDHRVKRFFREVDADIVVTTQVTLNLYAARYARPDTVVVAQEHLFLDNYKPPVRRRILVEYRHLSAIVTITETDANAYRDALGEHAGLVEVIPNSIPANPRGPSPLTEPVIMAAGRLTGAKGFSTLVEAFGEIAHRYPEWSVRIYGRGPERKRLQRLIGEYGLRARIKLPGPVSPLDEEWHKASIAVMTSHREAFGLVLVEAMAAGMPVVSTAAEPGPVDIVTDGVDGLFVEPGNAERLSEALVRLMDDPRLRHSLAAGARATARAYEPEQVVAMHEQLFERLVRAGGRAHAGLPRAGNSRL